MEGLLSHVCTIISIAVYRDSPDLIVDQIIKEEVSCVAELSHIDCINKNWVRVFTGSGLITGSDRIGPDRARNWPIPLLN